MLLEEGAGATPGSRQERIIVARSANLGLAPWLRVAAGLIVEVGGVLAHAACQARESGIPAVVLEGATCLLREGMLVSLDGETGRIEILESPQ
jgi:pyruvate,water dikinase